jgi:hypothetical protein
LRLLTVWIPEEINETHGVNHGRSYCWGNYNDLVRCRFWNPAIRVPGMDAANNRGHRWILFRINHLDPESNRNWLKEREGVIVFWTPDW